MAQSATQERRGSAKDYYERITQLIETTQVSAADAAKTVANELSKSESAVLNAYYRYARKLRGEETKSSQRSSRRRQTKTVDGYLADAKVAFEGALKRVDADVEDAQAQFDRVKDKHAKDLAALKARHAKELSAARGRLDDAKATVKAEKQKLEAKIKQLSD